MKEKQTITIINISSYIFLIIVNFLAVQIPFFGRSPGDVSDLYPNLLTPADFTFSIWSVIYLLLGVFVFTQSKQLIRNATSYDPEISVIGYYFLVTCILNVTWLLAWQSLNILLSFILIFALWIVLILINYKLTKFRMARLIYRLPFSCYLAWICIAALANLNVLFIDLEWAFFGFSEEYWTAGLVITGLLGTFLVLYLNQDIAFTLVLIWSFFGIYIKNGQLVNEPNAVMNASMFSMLLLLITSLIILIRKRKLYDIQHQ